jgi:ribonuclease P protein component
MPTPLPQGEGISKRLPREKRLRKRSEFATVYSRGRSWSHPLLALRVLPNQQPLTRFGFAIGKKVGGAVVRNRVKRRLREVVRQAVVAPGYDVVVIGRPAARETSYQDLQEALLHLFRRAGLLSQPQEAATGALPRS